MVGFFVPFLCSVLMKADSLEAALRSALAHSTRICAASGMAFAASHKDQTSSYQKHSTSAELRQAIEDEPSCRYLDCFLGSRQLPLWQEVVVTERRSGVRFRISAKIAAKQIS